jgi:hypothetical protein
VELLTLSHPSFVFLYTVNNFVVLNFSLFRYEKKNAKVALEK